MPKAGNNAVLAVLALRPADSALTVGEICIALDPAAANHCGAPLWKLVHKALHRLRARGLVNAVQAPAKTFAPRGPAYFTATVSGLAVAASATPITGGERPKGKPQIRISPFHDRLWTALRVKRRATLPELLQAASRDDDEHPVSRAKSYIDKLERAGIVIAQGKRNRRLRVRADDGTRLVTYILSRNLGPKTPAPQRAFVVDQNGGDHIPYVEKE